MRFVACAAVCNHGAVFRKLDRREHIVALTDGRLNGEAVIPICAMALRIRFGVGHDARGLVQFAPGLFAESEQLCIGVHFVDSQHAAHIKEKRVAGIADGTVHVHLAVHAEAAGFVIRRIIVVRAVAVHGVRGRRDDAFLQRCQGDKGLKNGARRKDAV